jgi:predicted O-methyltransferase YrrM
VGLLYDIMTSSPGIQNVCEVGFNSGHSALAFLEGIPNSRVMSFDLGAHQYVTVAFEVRHGDCFAFIAFPSEALT